MNIFFQYKFRDFIKTLFLYIYFQIYEDPEDPDVSKFFQVDKNFLFVVFCSFGA